MAAADRLWLSDRQVDLVTGDVLRAGENVARLTTKERELLGYLVGRANQDVARADLLTDVWGYAPTARTRAVDFTVRRLRQKVEADPADPAHVRTVHGVGYRFEAGTSPEEQAPVELPEGLPITQVTATGEEPVELGVVMRAFEGGARLVTLVGLSAEKLAAVGRHVAHAHGGAVVWLESGLDALAEQVSGADRAAARRLLLRQEAPGLLVIERAQAEDVERVGELAMTLRSVPTLRVLALGRRRLGLAAEHALSVSAPGPSEGDLTELDEAWAAVSASLREAWGRLSACTGSLDIGGAEALLGVDAVDLLEALQDAGVLTTLDTDAGLRFQLRPAAARYGKQRMGGDVSVALQERRTYLLERYAPLLERLGLDVPSSLPADTDELETLWADEGASRLDRVRAALLLGASTTSNEDLTRLEGIGDDAQLGSLELPFRLLRARLRLSVGQATASMNDARRALAAAHQARHATGEALSASLLASALMRIGRLREAAEAARHARGGYRGAGDRGAEVSVLQVLGRVEHELGFPDQAEATLREAVHLARLDERPVSLALGLVALGTLLRHRKRLGPSEEAYDEAARLLKPRHGVEVELVWSRLRLEAATLDLERGETKRALSVLEPLAGMLERRGRHRDAGEAWLAVAGSRWQRGDLDGAIDGFERGRTAFEDSEDRLYSGLSLAWSGATAAAAGELDLADAWIEESRAHLEPLGLRRGRDVLTACRAHVDHARGRPTGASAAWRDEVERSADTWGDVRLALRLLHPAEAR